MKIGLVLPGGGARGAYQVGVWKAMAEEGITSKIAVVSGVSVGAINAALFAVKDTKIAVELWENTKSSDIMNIKPERIAKIVEDILLHKKIMKIKPERVAKIVEDVLFHKDIMNIKPERIAKIVEDILLHKKIPHIGVDSILNNEGYISREGFIKMMDKYLDYEKISHLDKNIYVGCTNVSDVSNGEVILTAIGKRVGKVEYKMLNGKSEEEIKKILLASSSIPFVFDKTRINDNHYYDGGISESIPIKPVYNEECDLIYVIGLSRGHRVEESDYPRSKIVNIILEENYRSIIPPSLNFSSKLIKERIEKGYKDGRKILKSKKMLF